MTIVVLVGGSTTATNTAVSIIATAINGTTAMPTVTAVTIVGAEVAAEEPTHEEILAGLREGMQALKDERDGKDVSGQFRDFKALLNEL